MEIWNSSSFSFLSCMDLFWYVNVSQGTQEQRTAMANKDCAWHGKCFSGVRA
jgi:hypothetical protein